MGGGKTAAALTAIAELIRDKVIRHALVIAPKRVANNVWPDEIEAWEHLSGTLDWTLLVGTPEQRLQRLKLVSTRQITIIGLDNVGWLLDQLKSYPDDHPLFDLLVIDEISKLKDPTGVRAKLLCKFASRWKMIWGLSGTLRPNSALDLFVPGRVVTKGAIWGRSFYKWRQEYFYPIDFKGYQWMPLPGCEDKLNAHIAPYTVVLRDDEMPAMDEPLVILDKVELPPAARAQYASMHKRLVARVDDKDVLAANAAVATGKLAQIANGFLYSGSPDPVEGAPFFNSIAALPGKVTQVHDEKRQWLEDLVEQATAPMILVYEFIQDLEMIWQVAGMVPHLGAGSSDYESAKAIKDWNAGMLPFLALHPAAGGHGLNLQHGGADMAWVSPTWSPELWAQTIARLHRPGQKRAVIVRVCVANGTVDEMKLNRVHLKMNAQAAFEAYLATCASSDV